MTLAPCKLHLVTSNPFVPPGSARGRTVGRGQQARGGLTTGATTGAVRAIHGCAACLKKPREIDRLTEELQRLTQTRRDQERQAPAGFFGSATPSAKRPVTAHTAPAKEPKRKGARPGHLGAGRRACDASQAARVVDVTAEVGARGPDGPAPVEENGADDRVVLDRRPGKAERVRYRRPKTYGPPCRRPFQARAPAVLPTRLSGHQRLATAATRPSLHGSPLGRVCEQTGLGPGRLGEIFQRVARRGTGLPAQRVAESRQAPVKQADESGWRTNGHHGSAWRFATPRLRLLLCRQTRAASVPQHVFGKTWLPGCLVVARDGGSNKVPCAIQSGDSPLRREVQDLAPEFPAAAAVRALVRTVAPPLALAMGRRAQPLSDPECARQAGALKVPLMASLEEPAPHRGIRRLQAIFRAHIERLSHGAEDRQIPADNNLAERDLRPTVIARNVSVGSPSDAGAHTRGVLMSVLHRLKKRPVDVVAHLKAVLDQLALDIHRDPVPLRFPEAPT
jgi:transposase